MTIGQRGLALVLVSAAFGASSLLEAQTPLSGVQRTVYLTATNQAGLHLSDLTSADLVVKDGGKEWPILSLEPARTRLKVSLAIDEALSPDDYVRRAAYRLIEQLQGAADTALYLVGIGTSKIVDYTSNPLLFRAPLNGIPHRAQGGGNLVESLFQIAKNQRAVEGRRAIVILTTEIPQRSSMTANGVLDQLRDTGTVLHAATLVGPAGAIDPPTPEMAHLETMEEVERDRVLNEGPKQSGGLRLSLLRMEAFQAALDRIGAELLHQYVVTYLIPTGSKSDGRVSLAAKRKGITLRGPTQLPKI